MVEKVESDDFLGRFREIVSDPINLLIKKHPLAGTIKDGFVYLHNGNLVPISGPDAYYSDFSDILVINRGVHEPLEEYVFQELLEALPKNPVMLELGAYWGHYSMWLKKKHHKATVYLVEPDEANLLSGVNNFHKNGYKGNFEKAFVGHGAFSVDAFFRKEKIIKLNVLHADIQGYEMEMLEGAVNAFREKRIDNVLVSTHSQDLHKNVVEKLKSYQYRIEVSADVISKTTSFDGFVFASSPLRNALFDNFVFLGRDDILRTTPSDMLYSLLTIMEKNNKKKKIIFLKNLIGKLFA